MTRPEDPDEVERRRQRERSLNRAKVATELLSRVGGPFKHVEQDGDVVKIYFDEAHSDAATLNVIDMPVDRVPDPEKFVCTFLAQHAPEMTSGKPFRHRGGRRG